MDTEIKNALFERGADIVRFVDISKLSAKQTQGFSKAIRSFLWRMIIMFRNISLIMKQLRE